MRYLTLTLSLILGLATSVSANNKPFAVGDVFFCQMQAHVAWQGTEDKLKYYKLEKFKFSIVDSNTVRFGAQGVFTDLTLKIGYFDRSLKMLEAEDTYAKMTLENDKFNYVSSISISAKLVAATCDRF